MSVIYKNFISLKKGIKYKTFIEIQFLNFLEILIPSIIFNIFYKKMFKNSLISKYLNKCHNIYRYLVMIESTLQGITCNHTFPMTFYVNNLQN